MNVCFIFCVQIMESICTYLGISSDWRIDRSYPQSKLKVIVFYPFQNLYAELYVFKPIMVLTLLSTHHLFWLYHCVGSIIIMIIYNSLPTIIMSADTLSDHEWSCAWDLGLCQWALWRCSVIMLTSLILLTCSLWHGKCLKPCMYLPHLTGWKKSHKYTYSHELMTWQSINTKEKRALGGGGAAQGRPQSHAPPGWIPAGGIRVRFPHLIRPPCARPTPDSTATTNNTAWNPRGGAAACEWWRPAA